MEYKEEVFCSLNREDIVVSSKINTSYQNIIENNTGHVIVLQEIKKRS